MSLEVSRQATRFFISRVRSQVGELLLQDYPGGHPGPKLWLGVLNGLLDTSESYVNQSEQHGLPDQQVSQILLDASKLARTSYDLIEQMAGTAATDLHYSVVGPLQRWFEQSGLKNTTLFRAQLVANYEIAPVDRTFFDRIRSPASSLEDALNAVKWPLQRITVPSAAFGVLPHYAIVAHEIGHALFGEVTWDFSQYQTEEDIFWGSVSAALDGAVPSTDLVLFIQEVHNSWIAEIASDAFGYLMAGPAFFFALCGFLEAVGSGVGISESHPPNDLRRDLIFDRLQATNGVGAFTEVFERKTGQSLSRNINSTLIGVLPSTDLLIANLANYLPSGPSISSKEKAVTLASLVPLMKAISPQVYNQAEEFIRKIKPELIYSQDRFLLDLDMHLEPLLYAIPPVETRNSSQQTEPADFATILNVGWVALLAKLDQLRVRSGRKGDQQIEKGEALHSLLLKAVELSEAKRAWEGVP